MLFGYLLTCWFEVTCDIFDDQFLILQNLKKEPVVLNSGSGNQRLHWSRADKPQQDEN